MTNDTTEDLNLKSKFFADNVMAPNFRKVSRRLLADLSVVAMENYRETAEHHESSAEGLVELKLSNYTNKSAAFARGLLPHEAGTIISPAFNSALEDGAEILLEADAEEKTPVDEVIYLVRDANVGPNTSLDRLAKLLRKGIERGLNHQYGVAIEKVKNVAPEFLPSPGELCVLLIHRTGHEGGKKKVMKAVKHFLRGERTSNDKYGDPQEEVPPKVVYVSAREEPERALEWAKRLLPSALIWQPTNEAIMCSLIPTIIRPRIDDDADFEIEPIWERANMRFHRDKSILLADKRADDELPQHPDHDEIDRWGRNVMNRQVGVASSGGGASAYRIIALLEAMDDHGVPIDVFSGLSGGAVIGAYFCGNGFPGLDTALARGPTFQLLLPTLFFTTKTLADIIDADTGTQRIGNLSRKFHSITTGMGKDAPHANPPLGSVVTRATLGDAARAASALPVGFAPTSIAGRRYTDGMASAIVPTHVTIDHGADIVLACNCIPGPRHTNPFSDYWLGRLVYDKTILGRMIDAWSWIDYLTQTASAAEGFGSTAFYQFRPVNQASFEMFRWADAYRILDSAREEHVKIENMVHRLKNMWLSSPLQEREAAEA